MKGIGAKTVAITGAGRGLGSAFALTFADAGYDLILCGRNRADLEAVATLAGRRSGTKPRIVMLDLTSADSVADAAAQISMQTARVDILVNNAAMWLEASPAPYHDADVLAVVNSAISGTFLLFQSLRPLMDRSDTPDLVTIGSISGLPNAALQSVSVPFYAAKRGQVALAEGLRQEFAGTRYRSILINPPYLDDARPDQPHWTAAPDRHKGERATTRDVVEAALFALARPRSISLTIEMDADDGGLFPSAG